MASNRLYSVANPMLSSTELLHAPPPPHSPKGRSPRSTQAPRSPDTKDHAREADRQKGISFPLVPTKSDSASTVSPTKDSDTARTSRSTVTPKPSPIGIGLLLSQRTYLFPIPRLPLSILSFVVHISRHRPSVLAKVGSPRSQSLLLRLRRLRLALHLDLPL